MRSAFIFIISIVFSAATFGQVSDFISVKKKRNITVQSFFPGTYMSCRLVFGSDINGWVFKIQHDSVFIREYDVQALPNQWGTYSVDTLGSHIVAFHYKDIETVVFKKHESFSYVKNGTLLMIGGLGYVALNTINGGVLKESVGGAENRKRLAVGFAVAGTGALLYFLRTHANKFGRKYKITYTCMTCPTLKPF